MVLTNPPFYEAGAVRISPDPKKARAHVAAGGRESWMKAALALLAPGGLFLMVHRADALPGIVQGAEGRIGGLRLMPVLPRENEPAIRLLVGGRKGSRAPLAILPPLVLHGPDGRFTPRAEAVHRGEEGIDLGLH
jgi:tRNA1(Val) A37 N6-methylase TrmN6